MYAYETADQQQSDKVWLEAPDLILGTGAQTNKYDADMYYKDDTYGINKLRQELGNNDYAPQAVGFNPKNIYTMIDTMYDLAGKADAIVAKDSSKKLRYGNATDIATKFEMYVKGIQGVVLAGLAHDQAPQKKVALVNEYKDGSFALVTTGVAEGTATANRLLEATQHVAVNIADAKAKGSDGKVWVTAQELASADLIMLGSQSGSEVATTTNGILSHFTADMTAKTYWVDAANGSAGSCYGVTMNSVENAQNTGRILGCLYPEYVSQADLVAYYYDTFYHIANDKLADTVDHAMDLVRNWNVRSGANAGEYLQWSVKDVANYNKKATEDRIAGGAKYLASHASSVPSLLAPSQTLQSYLQKQNVPDLVFAAKNPPASSTQTPAPVVQKAQTISAKSRTVAYAKNKTFSLGAKAKTTLSYKSSNTKVVKVNSKGKVTIKGLGTAKITIKAAATPQYKAASKTITIKVKKANTMKLKKSSVTYKGKKYVKNGKLRAKKTYTIALAKKAKGKVTYKVSKYPSGAKKYISVSKKGKITLKKGAKAGTYQVTVTAAGNGTYAPLAKTVTVKVKK